MRGTGWALRKYTAEVRPLEHTSLRGGERLCTVVPSRVTGLKLRSETSVLLSNDHFLRVLLGGRNSRKTLIYAGLTRARHPVVSAGKLPR